MSTTTKENTTVSTIHPILRQPEGTVICVQVRSIDPPQFVAENMSELREQFPGDWGGEQCDNCGNSAYTIEPDPTVGNDQAPIGWVARCSGEPDTAEEYAANGASAETVEAVRNGCGTTYRLEYKDEDEVQF